MTSTREAPLRAVAPPPLSAAEKRSCHDYTLDLVGALVDLGDLGRRLLTWANVNLSPCGVRERSAEPLIRGTPTGYSVV